ncbi:MAG: dihydropteroate synthase, partial [Candidatus Brocadiia bacterium]
RAEGPWVERPSFSVDLPSGKVLDSTDRPLIMGILNVTPDSFSDGGEFFRPDLAVEHAEMMEAEGADIIDVGGESTRPGSEPVEVDEEMRRVLPVIEELAAETDVPISVDTQKSDVAREAISCGADMVNDVSGMRADPEMANVVAESEVGCCLMHMQGRPQNMQENPSYEDVVQDVAAWMERRLDCAERHGVDPGRIFLDPGFGFGKTPQHNLELLRRLNAFHDLGCPVMVGTSRKSTLGEILDAGADERLYGSLATVTAAVMSGCHMVRVHDVAPTLDTVLVCEAIRQGSEWLK